MSQKPQKQWLLIAVLTMAVFGLSGCKKAPGQENLSNAQQSENGTMGSEKAVRDANAAEGTAFSVEGYKAKLKEERMPILECAQNYQEEIEAVKETEYKNLHFKGCKFQDFPEISQVELLAGKEHGISVQESWDTIENWLEDIGKEGEVDMEREIRIVSPDLGLDANGDYFSFYSQMGDLESGEGAHIVQSSKCHIQIASNGIYSMSDGKITEYLGLDTNAIDDAMGDNCGSVVETGLVQEFGSKAYKLMDGELTVQKGAEMVKSYFAQGTPFPCAEGVSVDVPEVSVFHFGDVYGYDYKVRRVYRGLPFVCMDLGAYKFFQGNLVDGDIKHAYVVDSSGVSAFAGYNEAERLVSLTAEGSMVGLAWSMEHMAREMAPQLDVQAEEVELVYLPMAFEYSEIPEERIIFPCWQVTGKNHAKGENIRIYVDVLTGDIYYYIYGENR